MMKFPLESICALRHNWDGYGARPPTTEEITEARSIYARLLGDDWKVVPINSGGLQIERHRNGVDIEIQVVMSDEALAKKGRM